MICSTGAFLSISPTTKSSQVESIARLVNDSFFQLNFNEPGTQIGDHFLAGFQSAVDTCPPSQILHLANIDRLAFALETDYQERFIADVTAVTPDHTPFLFQRTEAAWASHPRHYREIEYIAIDLCRALYGRYLDIAWSHAAVRADKLAAILPQFQRQDMGFLAELVVLLAADLQTKDVDWLAWEDPFIYGRDPVELRQERDNNPAETEKRLRWLKPAMEVLLNQI